MDQYVLWNIPERFGCSTTKQTRRHRVFTDMDWAVGALTRKSVSCIVVRCGSHMFDSVANNFLVALSTGEA